MPSLAAAGHTRALILGAHAQMNEIRETAPTARANTRRNIDSLFLCDEFEALGDIAACLLELLLDHQRPDELEDVRAVLQQLKLLVGFVACGGGKSTATVRVEEGNCGERTTRQRHPSLQAQRKSAHEGHARVRREATGARTFSTASFSCNCAWYWPALLREFWMSASSWRNAVMCSWRSSVPLIFLSGSRGEAEGVSGRVCA